jgi:hypothetical protein
MFTLSLLPSMAAGRWQVQINFFTQQVRSDPDQLLMEYDYIDVPPTTC